MPFLVLTPSIPSPATGEGKGVRASQTTASMASRISLANAQAAGIPAVPIGRTRVPTYDDAFG